MGAFAFGTALSYPAVALPDLRVDPYFQTILTEGDESWIGAIFAVIFFLKKHYLFPNCFLLRRIICTHFKSWEQWSVAQQRDTLLKKWVGG